MEENNSEEKVVAAVDASQDLQTEFKIPDELPLLPVRDIVIFPYMILPLFVGRIFYKCCK